MRTGLTRPWESVSANVFENVELSVSPSGQRQRTFWNELGVALPPSRGILSLDSSPSVGTSRNADRGLSSRGILSLDSSPSVGTSQNADRDCVALEGTANAPSSLFLVRGGSSALARGCSLRPGTASRAQQRSVGPSRHGELLFGCHECHLSLITGRVRVLRERACAQELFIVIFWL